MWQWHVVTLVLSFNNTACWFHHGQWMLEILYSGQTEKQLRKSIYTLCKLDLQNWISASIYIKCSFLAALKFKAWCVENVCVGLLNASSCLTYQQMLLFTFLAKLWLLGWWCQSNLDRNFGSDWNISINFGWSAMKFFTDIHDPKNLNAFLSSTTMTLTFQWIMSTMISGLTWPLF